MNKYVTPIITIAGLLASTFIQTSSADGGGQSMEDLAKATQNPIADMISVPFQNNTAFNVGPEEKTLNVLNIQPVIPFELNKTGM